MRVTLIQDDLFWADKAANLRKTEQQLAALSGKTDLVVLPEMFTTGFCTDQPDLVETVDGNTVTTLTGWARQYNMAICGSFMAVENGNTYNRSFFVFPAGNIEFADKRHLFSMGGEQLHFKAGDKKMIVEYTGFRICLLVCYDIRFPVWSRNVNNEYDLLVYVANFPDKRISTWDILLKARAIENQAYVCGVNRVGTDGVGLHYNGHSVLLNYFGDEMLRCPDDQTAILTAELAKDSLLKYRSKFDVAADADRFSIQL